MNIKHIVTGLLLSVAISVQAQHEQGVDTLPFKGYLVNEEHNVYMRINFYDNDVVISWQEIFGSLPGFLAKDGTTYCWIVTETDINGNVARMEMVNDYGSEDLSATLTHEGDSIYTLRQESGSSLKVPVNGKWSKLPKNMRFVRKK